MLQLHYSRKQLIINHFQQYKTKELWHSITEPTNVINPTTGDNGVCTDPLIRVGREHPKSEYSQ